MDAGLEVGGTLGCDVGDKLVPIEGNGLMPDPDPADGGDPGDAEGGSTLDRSAAEDTVVGEPELGWPDVVEPALLGPVDVVPELTPDGAPLLAAREPSELAGGLAEPLGLADDRRLDTGLTLAGGGGLPETGEGVDGVLPEIPDDNADGLPMLEITGLAADDASDGSALPDDVPAELPTLTGEDCPELAVDAKLETPLYYDPLVASMKKHSITTSRRMAHFIAQIGHETASLRYAEEIADGSAYEGRLDLGNTRPGDGRHFKGRGLIQLTGRANYTEYSRYTGIDYVSKPHLVASDPFVAVDVACWYWHKRKINALADRDDVKAVTKAINGGYNGLDDRVEYLGRAKAVLGLA